MKIVILGAGQVGRTAAYHLSREEANEVTVVDTNEDVLRDLQDRLDIRTVAGNASYPSVLEAAGAPEADIIVALTSSDEVNMMACEVAYTLYRTPTKIARIRSAEYTSHPELFSEEAHLGRCVHQPGAAGHRIHRTPDPLSGRAAGARLRRRQGAAGRRARAQGRPAGRASAARAARASAENRRACGGHLSRRAQHDSGWRHRHRRRRRSVFPRRQRRICGES